MTKARMGKELSGCNGEKQKAKGIVHTGMQICMYICVYVYIYVVICCQRCMNMLVQTSKYAKLTSTKKGEGKPKRKNRGKQHKTRRKKHHKQEKNNTKTKARKKSIGRRERTFKYIEYGVFVCFLCAAYVRVVYICIIWGFFCFVFGYVC